jgi:signal transduction histidine kinase
VHPDIRGTERNRAVIARLESNSSGYDFYEYIAMPRQPEGPGFRGGDFGPPPGTLVYARFADTSEGRLYIIISAIITPVDATVMTLRYQLLIVSGVMIILSVIIAAVLSRRVSKPIEEINASAARLALADYDVRFSGRGFSEIVSLSDTLNTAAEELGKVEGLRRELIANVSHDLRTPLALIHSYAEMMRDFPDEITPEQLETIMDEAKRLTALVNDLLELSKLESEIGRIKITAFSITEGVETTVARMNELLKAEGFDIAFERGENIVVNGDKPKLERAFYNLLINAANYSGENKSVLVRQTVSENAVRISVIDHGEGIAEEELPFIWYRYYKSGKAHRRGVAGLGLGLSIVKRIMELHGGEYGVESELGRGSTFWLELKL